MATVVVKEVQHEAAAAEQLALLTPALIDAIYEELELFVGQELEIGPHTELLSVEGEVIRVALFVDTDGTLWIERMEARS